MTRSVRVLDEPPPEGTLDLQGFAATIRRRKWLVLVVTVVAAGLAALYSFTRPPVYTSGASVLLRPILANPIDTYASDQISLPTEISVARSASVANIADELLGSDSPGPGELLQRVSVTAPEEAQVIAFSYSDSTPGRAQAGAQAFADAYLQFKRQQALDTVAAYSTRLQTEMAELDRRIRELGSRMAGLVRRTPEWRELNDQRLALETTRSALQAELGTASTLGVKGGDVIQAAWLPTSPTTPRHRLNLAIGVLAGLGLGMVLASTRERLRDRIGGPDDLEQHLEAPVLGVTPRVSARQRRSTRLATFHDPRGVAAESYRTLRTKFLAVRGRPSVKTVLITSAGRGDGKTVTAANLGVVLAQFGKKVVLISGDLRNPRLHALFGVGNDLGLGQVLTGEISLADAICETSIPNLRIVPSGPAMGDLEPVHLLQSNRMLDIIVQCSAADVVLIDGAPILAVADSLGLTEMVDGVILVAHAQKGNRAAVARARDQLRQVGGRVLGGVLHGYEPRKSGRAPVPHDSRPDFRHRYPTPDLEYEGRRDGWMEPQSGNGPAGDPRLGYPPSRA
jgi:capsular exopolysaccharide synthesis family protein